MPHQQSLLLIRLFLPIAAILRPPVTAGHQFLTYFSTLAPYVSGIAVTAPVGVWRKCGHICFFCFNACQLLLLSARHRQVRASVIDHTLVGSVNHRHARHTVD